MEQMLGVKMRKPIVLSQFLANYQEELKDDIPKHTMKLGETMGLSNLDDEQLKLIAKNCSLQQMKQADDAHTEAYIPGVTEHNRISANNISNTKLQLQTVNMLLKSKKIAPKNPFQRSRDIYKCIALPSRNEQGENCNIFNELLITIRLYRPVRATHVGKSLEKPVFAEEFDCLGSNLLTELRDKITCVCNKHNFFDISDNPNAKLPEKKTDPGYFFITNTFYNDTRNPKNVDYSQTIRDWARSAAGLKNLEFKVATMQNVRFIDLTVSLGFPQLYQHHGNCEHVFTISQVEVISMGTQCTTRDQYPCLRSFGLFNTRLCNMCGNHHFAFIVEDSDRQLHDPTYLCNQCFYSFHYIDGKKIGKFRAYRVNNYYQSAMQTAEIDAIHTADGVSNTCIKDDDEQEESPQEEKKMKLQM